MYGNITGIRNLETRDSKQKTKKLQIQNPIRESKCQTTQRHIMEFMGIDRQLLMNINVAYLKQRRKI